MAFGKKHQDSAVDERELPGIPVAAPTSSTAVAPVATQPSSVALYDESDLGAGLKDLTQDDLQIPFLSILQKNSPQVEEDNPRYIPGAKSGMLFNTVTNRLYSGKDGVRFVPVHRVHNFIEWVPRDDGGGFVGVHEPDSEVVREALKKAGRRFGKGIKVGDNNDLVETFNVFALLLNPDDTFDRCVMGFSSSQIGRYKRMMTRANSIQLRTPDNRLVTPPLFAHVYRARTEFVSKNDYTWYKWLIDFDGADAAACRLSKDHPLYLAAKDFRAMVETGRAAAAYESQQQEGGDAGSTYDM